MQTIFLILVARNRKTKQIVFTYYMNLVHATVHVNNEYMHGKLFKTSFFFPYNIVSFGIMPL